MQRAEPDDWHERVVARDPREVDHGYAAELEVGQARPAHQHQHCNRQGAHPCPEQSCAEAEGQAECERGERNSLEARLGQADAEDAKHARQQQRVERHEAVVALVHVVEAGEQVGAEHTGGHELVGGRGLPGLVLVDLGHGVQVAHADDQEDQTRDEGHGGRQPRQRQTPTLARDGRGLGRGGHRVSG